MRVQQFSATYLQTKFGREQSVILLLLAIACVLLDMLRVLVVMAGVLEMDGVSVLRTHTYKSIVAVHMELNVPDLQSYHQNYECGSNFLWVWE